jgi:ABC-type branched-subunit amino acid transport system substrate-binding protein
VPSSSRGTRTRQVAAGISACALAVLASACGSSSGSSSGPIVIGGIAGSTGGFADVGIGVFNSVKLAVAQVNAKGGVMGRTLVFKPYDDAGSATLASEDFKHVISDGAVAVFGSPDEGATVATLADNYKLPDVGPVDDGGLVVYPKGPSQPPEPWVWSADLDTFSMGEIMAKYAMAHCKSIVLLHDTTEYGQGGEDGFKLAYGQAGQSSKILSDVGVAEDWTTGTPVSLVSEINKIKKSGADCVDVWLSPQDQATFVTTMHHAGDNFTILTNDNANDADGVFPNLAGSFADGVIAPQLTSLIGDNSAIDTFNKQYDAKFGSKVPAATNGYGAYQSVFLLAKAIETAKSTKNTALQAALNKTTAFPGLLGPITYTAMKHTATSVPLMSLEQYDTASKSWKPIYKG